MIIQIDPLLLHIPDCPCPCSSCPYAQNQTHQGTNSSTIKNITVDPIEHDTSVIITRITFEIEIDGTIYREEILATTTIEQNESVTIMRTTYKTRDRVFQITFTQKILWSYSEITDEANRTAKFILTETIAENISAQSYALSYTVQHKEYNLTLQTTLTPLNSEAYNSSFTMITYTPVGKSANSIELVEFKSPVNLSQLYGVLSKVAKRLGKTYEKSKDETLIQLAKSYYTMAEEIKDLAKLVKRQLKQYDRIIIENKAVIEDPGIPVCTFPLTLPLFLVFYCLDPRRPTQDIVMACCVLLYLLMALFLATIMYCIVTPGWGCLVAIVALIIAAIQTFLMCRDYCPSMQLCLVCVYFFVIWITIACAKIW